MWPKVPFSQGSLVRCRTWNISNKDRHFSRMDEKLGKTCLVGAEGLLVAWKMQSFVGDKRHDYELSPVMAVYGGNVR